MTCVLQIGGKEWGGWTGVSLRRSLEDVASSFAVSATLRYPGEADPVQIGVGSAVTVELAGKRAATGWIETVEVKTTAQGRQVTIEGRSKTCDLVDCSVVREGGAWRDRTVAQIAADVCGPFEIDVVAEVDTGAPLGRVRVQPGESAFDLLDRLAALRGLLLTDDPFGRLVITRAGSVAASGSLRLPGNVLESTVSVSASDRFSLYIVRGQSAGDDNASGSLVASISGEVRDTGVTRYRPVVIAPSTAVTPAGARAWAQWEARTRRGKSVTYKCSVAGWTQTDGGELWAQNLLARVSDDSAQVDASLLVVGVDYTLDDGGTIAALELAHPDGFALLDLPARRAGGAARASGGAWAELSGGVQ